MRLLAGLSQAATAELAGVHRETIGRLEAGRNTPSLQTAARIARALDCDDPRVVFPELAELLESEADG